MTLWPLICGMIWRRALILPQRAVNGTTFSHNFARGTHSLHYSTKTIRLLLLFYPCVARFPLYPDVRPLHHSTLMISVRDNIRTYFYMGIGINAIVHQVDSIQSPILSIRCSFPSYLWSHFIVLHSWFCRRAIFPAHFCMENGFNAMLYDEHCIRFLLSISVLQMSASFIRNFSCCISSRLISSASIVFHIYFCVTNGINDVLSHQSSINSTILSS